MYEPASVAPARAFGEEMYTRYFETIRDFLRAGLGTGPEAEDAAQEVFAGVLEGLSRYEHRSEEALRGWLFSIARSRLVDELRRRARVVPVEPRELDDRRERDGAVPDVADRLGGLELSETLRVLPPRQRQVLTLRYAVDFSISEIAKALGISAVAVRQSEFRALRALAGPHGSPGTGGKTPPGAKVTK